MQHFSTLLTDANRQVQIADHMLTVTYPAVKDPKILMSVVEHCRRSIEDAAEAVVEFHIGRGEYEMPTSAGKHKDMLVAFADLVNIRRPGIAGEHDAIKLGHDLRLTLQEYKEAPTAFPRDEKLVIASEGFSYLTEVTPKELRRSLHVLKQFVHGCNQHIILAPEKVK